MSKSLQIVNVLVLARCGSGVAPIQHDDLPGRTSLLDASFQSVVQAEAHSYHWRLQSKSKDSQPRVQKPASAAADKRRASAQQERRDVFVAVERKLWRNAVERRRQVRFASGLARR